VIKQARLDAEWYKCSMLDMLTKTVLHCLILEQMFASPVQALTEAFDLAKTD